MSQFSASLSTVPISFFDTSGSLVYIPAGTSESLFRLIDNNLQAFVDASSSMKIESVGESLEFKDPRDSFSFLYLSSSNNHPRIGIGTTNPKANIDFKDITDSTIGTEIILRTARSEATGALSGDEGGSINFTIDSGSFADLKTSGSLAKIKTIVNEIGSGGAQGVLTFTLSKGAGAEGIDAFKYGYAIGGEGAAFAQIQTGSLIITDFAALAPSKIKMVDYNGTTNFQVFEGDITASGDISASGNVYGVTGSFLLIEGGTF